MTFKLNENSADKWKKNALTFLAPVGILYITQVIGFIQQADGALQLSFFVPTEFTLGGISLYLLNSLLDYLKKLKTDSV